MSGPGRWYWPAFFAFGSIAVVSAFFSERRVEEARSTRGRCYATSTPTGRVRCWSGGAPVFEAATYRNGGILCTADGVELKLTGKDLCIEESRQADAWRPPAEK